MENANINIYAQSDLQFLKTIGEYIHHARLAQDKTQQQLADEAGINRTTLSQLEKGGAVNLLSLIQVLRSLKKLDVFGDLQVKPQLSPLQLAELEQKQRKRASRKAAPWNKPQVASW